MTASLPRRTERVSSRFCSGELYDILRVAAIAITRLGADRTDSGLGTSGCSLWDFVAACRPRPIPRHSSPRCGAMGMQRDYPVEWLSRVVNSVTCAWLSEVPMRLFST